MRAASNIEARDVLVKHGGPEAGARLEEAPVRLETIRKRVRLLEGRQTVAAKRGERRAKRLFDSTGEGVPVKRFLERVEVDGVDLRQIVKYSADWPVASGRMKLINVIDVKTLYWPLPAMFCGPYRAEMTAVALTNLMTAPTHWTPEELAENPTRGRAYGTPDLIEPDNEKAVLSPADVSALTELGPTVELPKVNHGDGKPHVEALNRFIRGWLEGLPGTVRGPRYPKDPSRNAVEEAEFTRATLWHQVVLMNRCWNEVGREIFGGLSSMDMVQACIDSGDKPKRSSRGDVRRALARTHENVVATREGVEFGGVVYQARDLGEVVDANFARCGYTDASDGRNKIRASIRTFEGDINEIEVFDEARTRYVVALSTEPQYTMGLSRYEHNEYKAMEARKHPAADREVARMRARASRLRQATRDLPKASSKAAASHTALIEAAEVRRASGARAFDPDFGPDLVDGILAKSGRSLRTDVPAPVHVPGYLRGPKVPAAPAEFLAKLGADPASENVENGQQTGRNPSIVSQDEDHAWPELPPEEDDDEEDDR